tara:strand:- start:1014 stop:1517 length:504 start_codon:yes stop_codon:yes gene_type:complete
MRKNNDFYPTPHSFINALVKNIPYYFDRNDVVWECCAGDNRLVDALKKDKRKVIATDISNGEHEDFFNYKKALAPTIITNPPFKDIRKFIDHAFDIGVWRMMIFCNERLFACKKGYQQIQRHRPAKFINLSWREDFLGKGGKPDRSMAIAQWSSPHTTRTIYEVWDQ